MTPEKIEVKLALVPDDAERARTTLGPPPGETIEKREIHFLDTKDLELFDRGLILRIRLDRENEEGDITLKVRGDGAEAAAARFLSNTAGAKFEGDKTVGRDQILSFSVTSKHKLAALESVLAPGKSVEPLLEPNATTLLRELGGPAADPAGLLRLGPIRARTWKLKPATVSGKVTAELWELAGTSLFELSEKVKPADVPGLEKELLDLIKSLGFRQLPTSKARFALDVLRPKAV
jgi:hypothetical protein